MSAVDEVPLLEREDLPQLKLHISDWIQWMEGLRVFIDSRERIKRPEGVDLHEEKIEAMRAVLSIVTDSIEHAPLTNGRAATYNTATHKVVPIDAEVWPAEAKVRFYAIIDSLASHADDCARQGRINYATYLRTVNDELARVMPKPEGE